MKLLVRIGIRQLAATRWNDQVSLLENKASELYSQTMRERPPAVLKFKRNGGDVAQTLLPEAQRGFRSGCLQGLMHVVVSAVCVSAPALQHQQSRLVHVHGTRCNGKAFAIGAAI